MRSSSVILQATEDSSAFELPMNPHTYRKTVGTKIGHQDIEKAAAQLGHSTSEVTKRHYVAPAVEGPDAREYLEDFAETVDEFVTDVEDYVASFADPD